MILTNRELFLKCQEFVWNGTTIQTEWVTMTVFSNLKNI